MILNSRKGLSYFSLVALIISIVTVVILIFYVGQTVDGAGYDNSLIMCNQFFESVNGKPLYFGLSSSEFTPKFQNSIYELCPSKSVEVSDENVKAAANLIKDCWFEFGNGDDIMPKTGTDLKLCVYCGKILAKEDVDDFKKKLNGELSKDEYSRLLSKESESVNLNPVLFESSQFPDILAEDKEIYLFYQIQKPLPVPENIDIETWYRDEVLGGVRNFMGENLAVASVLNYYLIDEIVIGQIVRTSVGVVAVTEDSLKESEFGDDVNNIVYKDCFVVVPKNDYD